MKRHFAEPQLMRVRRKSTTDETRLLGDSGLIGAPLGGRYSQRARQFKILRAWQVALSIKMRCAMKSLFCPPIGLRFLLVADA
jgi:hypothetical protein